MKQAFGQVLRDLRRSKGMSQREVAEKVGVDFSYLSKIENSRLPPPAADTIVRICSVLGVRSEELLALTRKVPSDIREVIGSSPGAMQFIRSAQSMGLTEGEWKELTRQLKRLRD